MRVTYFWILLLLIVSMWINSSYALDNEPINELTNNVSESMAWINEANSSNASGKYDEAIMDYDEAIRLHPEDSVAWYKKGYALQSQGKYDEAIEAYDEAGFARNPLAARKVTNYLGALVISIDNDQIKLLNFWWLDRGMYLL